MPAAEIWARVAEQRRELADRIESLEPAQWDSPSWCEGWRVRDVVGHLVHLAEAGQVSMARDLVRGRSPDRALSIAAVRHGQQPVPELTRRLRQAADGRFRIPGFPPATVLAEVVVHGSDALRPLGQEVDVAASDLVPVLNLYRRIGRVAFRSSSNRQRRLVATDVEWASGQGVGLQGRAIDLLLLLANRTQVTPLLKPA